MKIHHLDCGSMCPLDRRLFPGFFARKIVCHCLLIEDRQRLILIDTGIGVADTKDLRRLGLLGWSLRVEADEGLTAFERIKALGFSPSDVTDIIPTHLDLDHAGGIPDFPGARVHVSRPELAAARAQSSFKLRQRYRSCHLSAPTRWGEFEPAQGERWKGFDCVKELAGLPPEVLLVRLPGHTPGHFGIAVEQGERWLLHAGDAYYDRKELVEDSACPRGLGLFHKHVHIDAKAARRTQRELARLKEDASIEVFCSHDPRELRSVVQTALSEPQRQAHALPASECLLPPISPSP